MVYQVDSDTIFGHHTKQFRGDEWQACCDYMHVLAINEVPCTLTRIA